MKPRETITAVSTELERRARAFERARDPRCVFARAHAEMNRVLADALPYAGFRDPAWIAALSVRFADRYLDAVREYDATRMQDGPWATVFRASERGRTSVREELVLGMTAHIVSDLPQVICEVGMRNEAGDSRIADYHLMNEVLGQAIERIHVELSRRYDPVLGLLDQLSDRYDEIITNYGVRMSRAAAWYNAQRLADPSLRDDALASIAQSPEVTMREVLDPPIYSLRFLLRLARRLTRLARVWPSDPRVRPIDTPYVSEPNIDLEQISLKNI
ncbi:MAG: DUF5995 family protein [Polyangiales bacterium]